jgi:hypothetical protein
MVAFCEDDNLPFLLESVCFGMPGTKLSIPPTVLSMRIKTVITFLQLGNMRGVDEISSLTEKMYRPAGLRRCTEQLS